jgi:hypothetical protein
MYFVEFPNHNLVAIIQEGKTTEQDLLNFRIVSLSSFYFFILVRQKLNLSHLVRYKI